MKSAIQEKLAFEQARIELAIDEYLPAKQVRPTILHQAMRYSMQAGGKRIRPVLLILGSEILKVPADTAKNTPANPLAAAVAIECCPVPQPATSIFGLLILFILLSKSLILD